MNDLQVIETAVTEPKTNSILTSANENYDTICVLLERKETQESKALLRRLDTIIIPVAVIKR